MVSLAPKVEALPTRRAFEITFDHVRALVPDLSERRGFYRVMSGGRVDHLQQRFVFEILSNDADDLVELSRRADGKFPAKVGALAASHPPMMPTSLGPA
jgi:hypothetical protein